MRTIRLLLALATGALLAACGGGGDDPPPPAAVAPNISAAGGTATSSDGKAVLTVPAGAASTPMTVTLEADGSAPPAGVLAGSLFRLGGDGGALAADATLEIDTGSAFPAVAVGRAAAAGRKFGRPYTLRNPDSGGGTPPLVLCDVDGDGDLDGADAAAWWANGGSCHAPPQLVAIGQTLQPLGGCGKPLGSKASCTLKSLSPALLGLLFDTTAPTITVDSFDFPTFPNLVTQAGTYSLRVVATDPGGIAKVDFYKIREVEGVLGKTLIDSDTATPYQATFTLGAVDADLKWIVAEATDTNGNLAAVSLPLKVQLPGDTTPPTITLAAAATSVQVGQQVTVDATAADDGGGSVLVRIYRDGTQVAMILNGAYTYTTPVLTVADIGTTVFTAIARDAAGNETPSNAVSVTVAAVGPAQAWVSPTGNDAAAGTAAAPFKTLGKAFATVGAGGKVWLLDGLYTAEAEGLVGPPIFNGLGVPAGVALEAVNPGGATLAMTLRFEAGGSAAGLRFDASSLGRVLATGGTLTLSRPQWVKLGTTMALYGIEASGDAKVFVDAGGVPAHNYAPSGLTGIASLSDASELHVTGGRVDGSTGQGNGIQLDGTAKLVLKSFGIFNTSGAWVGGGGAIYVGGTGNRVELDAVTIDLANAPAVCLLQDRQIPGAVTLDTSIVVLNSLLKSCGGGGIHLREGTPGMYLGNTRILSTGRYGLEVGQIGFDSGVQFARPEISIAQGSEIAGNALGGIWMNHGGVLGLLDTTVTAAAGTRGIQLLGTVSNYVFLMKDSVVDAPAEALWLEGNEASLYNLGTGGAGGPGNNTISGGTTGIRVSVAADVVVRAIGNTWKPSVQGADAGGHYSTASSVCTGASPCDVTTGSGANYQFVNAGAGAALRLAE